jgi:DNA repair protein RecN (Recombination protein N)
VLRELRVRDFAIIDQLSVRFTPGLNVLTGETGAGKSIIIDALGLALGERAQSDMIRTGKGEAVVEALFDNDAGEILERFGIPIEDDLILRRNLLVSGKSRAYINGTMANIQTLYEVGRSLVDIHGQHEHQSLLSPDIQRFLVDAYGKLHDERVTLEKRFHEIQAEEKELLELTSHIRDREQRSEFLSFQVREIETASLRAGEKESLEDERKILANLTKLIELTDGSYSLLYSGEGAASEKVSKALTMLREVSQIDHGVEEILGLLESAKPLLDDAANSLRRYRDKYDADPHRLDLIEERLELIRRLERKYGEGIEGILHYRDKASRELETLSTSDDRVRELERNLMEKENRIHTQAARLTEMRRAVSQKIEHTVNSCLRDLSMDASEFRIDLRKAPLSSKGEESIEFLLSSNKGEAPKPLNRVASGGELSRIMLALKESLAEVDQIPVLIFDEVDAGIGGRVAERVGKRLWSLGERHQVLCITHLPQIAAMADHHIIVERTQGNGNVCVKVKEPSLLEREEEIARMLSGKITDISMRHARELLGRLK